MALITVSINLIYEPQEGVGMDDAVAAVTMNLKELMKFAGIDSDGRPVLYQPADGLPIFCPPPLAEKVDLHEVKQLMVVGG